MSNSTVRKGADKGNFDSFSSKRMLLTAMVFSRSMTIDDEEVGRAVGSATTAVAPGRDDSLFVERLRTGEAAAFDTLVERYSGDIYALLFRLTENAEEAADLTQDTFVRAYRSAGSFRGESSLKTWLYRIAVNESHNRFRWWKRRRRHLTISIDANIGDSDVTVGDTIADNSISPEEATLRREREYALRTALAEVPQAYREAVVLCDIEGLSYQETASALSIGIGTVKSRLARGREELRRRLRDY